MTREPTEMELRVAEAIKDAFNIARGYGEIAMCDGRELICARAAICAMREPTEEMLEGMVAEIMCGPPITVNQVWAQGIDAASPPEGA